MMIHRQYGLKFHVFCLALLLPCSINAAAQPTTTRVSVGSSGTQGNNWSYNPSISANGRYVAFKSDATNLVPGDNTTVFSDVFVRDRVTDTTTLVSVASDGTHGNKWSSYAQLSSPSISANGRYVAFSSLAYNLVASDTNNVSDIFVHDRETGETTRVSINSSGVNEGNDNSDNPSISADGRFVAFQSYASNLTPENGHGYSHIFVRDRVANTTTMVSVDNSDLPGNSNSEYPAISADGRFVAFESSASNLVGADANGVRDIFVRDLTTHTTTRVSIKDSGLEADQACLTPAISADGRYVAFESASPLVAGDSNGKSDIFVRDRTTNTTTRISVASSGNQGNEKSFEPSISGNGRYVSFSSLASNLVPGDSNGATDVFVHDRQTGVTTRVSSDSNSNQGNNESYTSAISGDGHYVAFASLASNLVPDDTNIKADIFVRGPLVGFPWEMFLPAFISSRP